MLPMCSLSDKQTFILLVLSTILVSCAQTKDSSKVRLLADEESEEPQVLWIEPSDGAVEVSVDENITVVFSEAIDKTSLDDLSVTLLGAGNARIPLTFTYATKTNTLTIDPQVSLDSGQVHQVSLTSSITDLAGNHLESFSSSFSTASIPLRVWHETQLLNEKDHQGVSLPMLASEASGKVMAFWKEEAVGTCKSNGDTHIFMNEFIPDKNWGTAKRIVACLKSVENIDASRDGDQALLVWDSQASEKTVQASFFDGSSWSSAETIGEGVGLGGTKPTVSYYHNRGIAAWRTNDQEPKAILAAEFQSGSGWQTPQVISERDEYVLENVESEMSVNGDTLIVWLQYCLAAECGWDHYRVHGRIYKDSKWQKGQWLDFDNPDNFGFPTSLKVASNSKGDFVVAWMDLDRQNTEAYWSVLARAYIHNVGWTKIRRLNKSQVNVSRIAVDIAEDGTALVVWSDQHQQLLSNWYTPDVGWQLKPESVAMIDDQLKEIDIATTKYLDQHEFIAIWHEKSGQLGPIYSSYYRPHTGWSQKTAVSQMGETICDGAHCRPRVSGDQNGRATAIWQIGETLFGNHFE